MLCRYIVPCGLTSLQPVSIKVGGYAYSKIEYVKICVYLINFDFILYYNLLLCFIQLEMHVRLICAIKFYLLTYLFKTNRNCD